MISPAEHVFNLCRKFQDGELNPRLFSDAVECFWNFGEWQEPWSDADEAAIKKLLDVVVWFSEVDGDTYPRYRTADDVKGAAREFCDYLRRRGS